MLQIADTCDRNDPADRAGERYALPVCGSGIADEAPALSHLLDTKAVEAAGRIKQEKELVQKVAVLEQQLEDTRMLAGLPETEEDAPTGDIKTYDVILRVKPEKASLIKSQVINGQKCLVIPMEENEHAAINGVNTTV